MNSTSMAPITGPSLVPFPSSTAVPSASTRTQVQTSPRNSTYSTTTTSSYASDGTSYEFQTTFSKVFESVRRMRIHIEAFNSSALISTSYDFESNLLCLLLQITEVTDQCMAFGTDESRYETSYTNVRFTLRTFMETVESRLLNKASICLTFVVDAMYTFMEICISEISRWRTPKVRQESIEIPRDHTMFCAPSNLSTSEGGFCAPQLPADLVSGLTSHKPSILKRLRTFSNITLRRQKHSSEPPNGGKGSIINPAVAKRMERHLRASIDQIPQQSVVSPEECRKLCIPPKRESEIISPRNRPNGAIRHREPSVGSRKREVWKRKRQSWPFANRSHNRSRFKLWQYTLPVTPAPPLIVV